LSTRDVRPACGPARAVHRGGNLRPGSRAAVSDRSVARHRKRRARRWPRATWTPPARGQTPCSALPHGHRARGLAVVSASRQLGRCGAAFW